MLRDSYYSCLDNSSKKQQFSYALTTEASFISQLWSILFSLINPTHPKTHTRTPLQRMTEEIKEKVID